MYGICLCSLKLDEKDTVGAVVVTVSTKVLEERTASRSSLSNRQPAPRKTRTRPYLGPVSRLAVRARRQESMIEFPSPEALWASLGG